MSIDLSYPLVPSMGQHDPLDGWITYKQLQATAAEFSEAPADLEAEIHDMTDLCRGKSWATEDPLGIGGLLVDACKLVQLTANDDLAANGLLPELLDASLWGLNVFMAGKPLKMAAEQRLAFRELGLAIGLQAVDMMGDLMQAKPDMFGGHQQVSAQIERLQNFIPLGETIAMFWLEPHNRNSRIWDEHRDINSVMLATSLMPEGYLELL